MNAGDKLGLGLLAGAGAVFSGAFAGRQINGARYDGQIQSAHEDIACAEALHEIESIFEEMPAECANGDLFEVQGTEREQLSTFEKTSEGAILRITDIHEETTYNTVEEIAAIANQNLTEAQAAKGDAEQLGMYVGGAIGALALLGVVAVRLKGSKSAKEKRAQALFSEKPKREKRRVSGFDEAKTQKSQEFVSTK